MVNGQVQQVQALQRPSLGFEVKTSTNQQGDAISIRYGYGNVSGNCYSHIPGVQLHYADSVESIPRDTETRYITHMYIRGRLPSSIKSIASKLKHLKIRKLKDANQLKVLAELEHLEVLDLSHSELSKKRQLWAVSKLPSLKELYLQHSKLPGLPHNLKSLKHLEVLILNENRFDVLPSVVSKLPNLRRLHVDSRLLSQRLTQMKQLEVLKLDCNGVVDFNVISELSNLKELHLECFESPAKPWSIKSLTHLEILDVRSDSLQISDLPDELSVLANLRELYFKGCGLTDLPASMSTLKTLEKLDVSHNNFFGHAVLQVLHKLENLRELFMKDCNLRDLPKSMSTLKSLEKLDVSLNDFSGHAVLEVLHKLENLRELFMKDCNLRYLPKSMSTLKSLEKLDVSLNDFCGHAVLKVLHKLENLREIFMKDSNLRDLPLRISSLRRLEILDMSWNSFKVVDLLDELSALVNLKELYLQSCGLKKLSASIKSLKHLEILDLRSNVFKGGPLPDELSVLVKLRKLYFRACGLTDLPASMSTLKSLEKLDVSFNNFSGHAVLEVLPKLENLQDLFMKDCKLRDLPERLSQLKKLRRLEIPKNNFSNKLPSVIYEMSQLERLNIRRNPLEIIGAEIRNLKQLQVFDCAKCGQLRQPPVGVSEQGFEAVKKYFKELKEEAGVEQTIVPVVVLGNTMAGKTSVIRSLQEGERKFTFREKGSKLDEATRVFKMESLEHNGIQYNFIDFGGHNVYHIACQLGIKDHCVPIFVVNLEEYNKLETDRGPLEATRRLWFDYMSHLYLVRPKLGSPILVLTHKDRISSERFELLKNALTTSAKRIRNDILEDEAALSNGNFSKIKCFADKTREIVPPENIFVFSNDISETSNILGLKNTLEKCCHKFAVVIPRLWERVNSFVNEHQDKPYMDVSEIEAEFPHSDALIIIRYLHNIGRILWYEEKETLSKLIFHQIPKLTELIGCLFSHTQDKEWKDRLSEVKAYRHEGDHISKELYIKLVNDFKRSGIMVESVLQNMVKCFPLNIAVEILKAFQIIYGPVDYDSTAAYIIPYFSSEFMDNSWQNQGYLQLRVSITFPGLLSLPDYVYQQMSVVVLETNTQPGDDIRIATNGLEIYSGYIVTHLIHDHNNRRVTLQLSTTKLEFLSQLWEELLKSTRKVLKKTTIEWPAAHPVVHIYCSHCLFMKEKNPSLDIDPAWFKDQQVFDGVDPVACECYTAVSGRREPAVPTPLRYPCLRLTQQECDMVENFLTILKPQPVCPPDLTGKDKSPESNFENLGAHSLPIQSQVARRKTKKKKGSQAKTSSKVKSKIPKVLISPPDMKSGQTTKEDDSELSDVEIEGYLKSGLLRRATPLALVSCSKRRIKELYYNTRQAYPVSDPVRGRVLILNVNIRHENSKPISTRPGSEVDFRNISNLFTAMGFCIAKSEDGLTDLTNERIFEEIRAETKIDDHHVLGMFVLVLMGHGVRGDYLIDVKGKSVDIAKIKDLLSPNAFRAMSGKPKLVIIQACSGGVMPRDILDPPSAPPTIGGARLPKDMSSLNGVDMFVMKASDESFAAIRKTKTGSWFITTLVATFYKHACHRDVESLFRIVKERLCQHIVANPPKDGRRVGLPTGNCTFTNYPRKLYFFPGYSPPK